MKGFIIVIAILATAVSSTPSEFKKEISSRIIGGDEVK